MPEVKHPALAHKYQIVRFTRGIGIEVGEGITPDSEPLYAHFRKIGDVEKQSEAALGQLDFVLVCADLNALGECAPLVKPGGHLLYIGRTAYDDVVQRMDADPSEWDLSVYDDSQLRSLFVFKKL